LKLAKESVGTSSFVKEAIEAAQVKKETLTAEKLAPGAKPFTWYPPVEIPTEQSRENVAYGTLATPDEVASVVLPAKGLIAVKYQASWQESVLGTCRAAIFIGANQLKITQDQNPTTGTQAAMTGVDSRTNIMQPLLSAPFGLISPDMQYGSGVEPPVTTGQAIASYSAGQSRIEVGGAGEKLVTAQAFGGACEIFAAAGTYNISVQFKASSGNVKVKNRKLWVGALGY